MNRSLLLHKLDAPSFMPLLEGLLAITDDAVVVADADQRVVLFNEAAERLFAYTAVHVLGQPLSMLVPAAVRDGHERHVRGFADAPTAARRMGERGDIRGLRSDGSTFDAEASISRVELEGRVYFAAIVRDVTQRRETERAMARSEARFRGLAELAPVGIFQTDAAGACTYVNDRWCSIVGIGAGEAIAGGWERALHPADRDRFQAAWRYTLEQGSPFSLEYRLVRPDGGLTWVIGSAVANRDLDGTIGGFVGTVTDVTASHEQTEALERAKSQAEAAARARTQFLANMSHEIRTPLNAVIGMTTLLLDTPMSEDQRDFARTIRASGESLLEIVDDVLDYSKADAGRLEIERQRFDLRACLEDALDLVTPRARDKKLNLAYLIEDETPESLVGDVARVRQVLANLLSNAVKFTHEGEVLVSVDAQALDDGACLIRVDVRDTGIGIAPEHLPRLFRSFSQVDASTTRKYGGTGLGLAISRRLAELMGGGLTVDSRLGAGSVFHFTFAAQAAPAERAEYLQRHAPALSGKRLLIVDDNLTNRRILTKLALLWGMVPTTLSSGLEALDLVRHGERFDLAVLDMNMPDMDGSDLAAALRGHRSARHLPLVLLTSLGQRTAGDDGALSAFAARLPKPIKASQLFATLVAVVTGSQPDMGGRAQRTAPPAPSPAPAPLGPASPSLRLLVAEDNPINQKVAQRLLQRLGYQADVVANGLEVLDAVERERYDVVLMDIQMPEMDGVQAARWIADRRGADGAPRIIAMTANAMPGDRERYLAAGMDGYVAKPIDSDALAAALHRADLRMHAVPVVPPAPSSPLQSVDHTRLAHLRSLQAVGEPDLLHELIDMFITDAPAHVALLGQALADADVARLRATAHRLLSITDNLGAHRMSALCAQIERLAREHSIGDVGPLFAELRDEELLVREALQSERLRTA